MARRIRILHVIPSLDVGGMENGVVNVINVLPADRFEHHVACLLHTGPLAERIRGRAGVTEMHAGRHDPIATLRLARTILRYRPHIVHARNWNAWPDAAAACAITGIGRLVWSIHGWTTDQRMTRMRALACRQLARSTHQLCGVCLDAAARFADEAGVPLRRFEIVYNGVDARRFTPRTDRAALRATLGLPPETFVIGTVGRFDPMKRYDLLIEAVARLREEDRSGSMPAVQLVFAGDGPEETRLRETAARLGVERDVRFLGRRSDVPAVLAALDLFTLTSRGEGMSNAILEAMACGLPVVATRVGGNAEIVMDGETGLLIESANVEQLVAALRRLIGQPGVRAAMGAAGRQRVESAFTMQRMAEAYTSMYDRVAKGRNRESEKMRK